MKKQEVVEYFSKWYPDINPINATAKALGITRQAVYLWGENIPKSSQPLIELLSKGDIKRDKTK